MDVSYQTVAGGSTSYGRVMGILSLCSAIPRLAGDPGHAETFDFPVLHAEITGVTIQELIDINPDCLDRIVATARQLEEKGVSFITTCCGLYAPFQQEIANRISVPFLSSALQMVPFLRGFLPERMKVGVITGHAGLLNNDHLRASGFRLEQVVVKGMEDYPEFERVVLKGALDMDIKRFRRDVINAASSLKNSGEPIGLVVLECPNLIPFRTEIQQVLQAPVYDIVTLANFFVAGFRKVNFRSRYI